MLWVRALFLGACTDPRLCPQHPSSELKFASAVVAVFHASRRVARSITRAMDTDTQVYKYMSMPEYASFHVRVSGMTRDEAEWKFTECLANSIPNESIQKVDTWKSQCQ